MDSDDATGYHGPAIPKPLGEQLQTVFATDERPRRFGDVVDAVAGFVDRAGVDADLEALCTTDESPHRATFRGGTQHYLCTFDALIVPFITDDVTTVDVETVSPIRERRVTFSVSADGIDADPPDAVLSFGVASDAGDRSTADHGLVVAYRQICPHGKAFASRAEYDEWASTVDAHTTVVSMADALELARALGRAVE